MFPRTTIDVIELSVMIPAPSTPQPEMSLPTRVALPPCVTLTPRTWISVVPQLLAGLMTLFVTVGLAPLVDTIPV